MGRVEGGLGEGWRVRGDLGGKGQSVRVVAIRWAESRAKGVGRGSRGAER